MRLADCFAEPMAYAACLVASPEPAPFETARPAVEGLLVSGRTRAEAAGAEPGDVDDAMLAVCAWIDETVLGSAWEGRAQWMHRPLQRQFCNTVNAGEEFFRRLTLHLGGGGGAAETIGDLTREAQTVFDGLGRAQPGSHPAHQDQGRHVPSASPPEGEPSHSSPPSPQETRNRQVIEVFAVCLNLGFTGRYFAPSGHTELRRLQSAAVKAVLGPRARDLAPPRAKICPWLYDEEPRAGVRRVFWRGLDALDAALLLVPALGAAVLYFLYNRLLTSSLSGFLGFGP